MDKTKYLLLSLLTSLVMIMGVAYAEPATLHVANHTIYAVVGSTRGSDTSTIPAGAEVNFPWENIKVACTNKGGITPKVCPVRIYIIMDENTRQLIATDKVVLASGEMKINNIPSSGFIVSSRVDGDMVTVDIAKMKSKAFWKRW